MELNQLKQFQVVAKYENISRASEELYISQPSLTRAMYNLENDLGVSLFKRKKNKIKLNNCGKHILKQVDIILNEAELLKKWLRNIPNATRFSTFIHQCRQVCVIL